MLGIFAAWAIPYFQMTHAGHTAEVWTRQFSDDSKAKTSSLATGCSTSRAASLTSCRGWRYFPSLASRCLENPEEKKFARALSLGVGIPFVAVSLVPGRCRATICRCSRLPSGSSRSS
jgi:hypothetical protein